MYHRAQKQFLSARIARRVLAAELPVLGAASTICGALAGSRHTVEIVAVLDNLIKNLVVGFAHNRIVGRALCAATAVLAAAPAEWVCTGALDHTAPSVHLRPLYFRTVCEVDLIRRSGHTWTAHTVPSPHSKWSLSPIEARAPFVSP